MPVPTLILSALTLASAILNIRAEYIGPRHQVYVFKPLTTLLILLIALWAPGPVAPLYRYAILAGLAFSLAGDVFLMLPQDRFVAGLVSFLAAHLCYIVAFSSGVGFGGSLWSLAPLLAYVVIMFGVLSPHLDKMRLPVLVYELVIVTMAWQAFERWASMRDVGGLLALLGAALFVISDSALAINRFMGRFGAAQALILGTYFSAQWLIALSV